MRSDSEVKGDGWVRRQLALTPIYLVTDLRVMDAMWNLLWMKKINPKGIQKLETKQESRN